MASKEYFRRRYRRSLIALAIVWGLASPVIIFDEWWVQSRYQQYVQRVTHPPAAGLVDYTGKELPPGTRVGLPTSGPAKDAPVDLSDWTEVPPKATRKAVLPGDLPSATARALGPAIDPSQIASVKRIDPLAGGILAPIPNSDQTKLARKIFSDPDFQKLAPAEQMKAFDAIMSKHGAGYAKFAASDRQLMFEDFRAHFEPKTSPMQRIATKPDFSKWREEAINSQDVDPTNLDNSPLELESWEKSEVGHPRYYSTVAALEPWAWGIAIVGSLPWLWYFLLVRITEIASAFRGNAGSPTEKKD
jgi:hypothetical protein